MFRSNPSRVRPLGHIPFRLLLPAAMLVLASAADAVDISKAPASDWINLFNGKDLEGWVPKVKGTAAAQDPLKTWYVKDGLLWVDYSQYTGDFNNRFGHLAYQKRKFSHYVVHAEANTWGKQAAGAPDWAYQNNGLMLHSQSMESMSIDQEFPTSVECQFLGSMNKQNSDGLTENGITANVCGSASNTSMIINGTRQSPGCFTAKRVKIDSAHFQVVEALVLGDSLFKHMVAGDTGKPLDTVLTYSKSQTKNDAKPLTEGYIAIQGESAPWKFRKIRVLDLVGCMDPKYASYRDYFVKHDATRCTHGVGLNGRMLPSGYAVAARAGALHLNLPEGAVHRVRVLDLAGRLALPESEARGPSAEVPLAGLRAGAYLFQIRLGNEAHLGRFAIIAP